MHDYLLELKFHENTPTNEIYPAPGLLWWQWALIGLALFVSILLIRILLSIKSSRVQPSVPAIITLRKELSEIPSHNNAQSSFAVSLSTAFRHFLYRELKSESLFQTNEEINLTLLQKLELNDTTNSQILELLNQLENIKYNKGKTLDSDPEKIKAHTLSLAETIHSKRKESSTRS